MIENAGENNGFKCIPSDNKTAWQLYRKYLIDVKDFDEDKVKLMEAHSWRVLKKLSLDTTKTAPIRGMVVGNVQSGKTANMAALMSMAADFGWNMFIVLSGTIENLRLQTYDRLNQDLKSGNITWHPLGGQLGPKSEPQAQALTFENNQIRYYTVCLKNSKRLENLIKWLLADPNKPQHMKLLIIDDEADQAGINTKPLAKERSAINRILCNLVNNRTPKDDKSDALYQAVNYVGYTATPYANFLNEIGTVSKGRVSLFPENFVATIAVSKEYFGPQQIFGLEGNTYSIHYDGLNILRNVSSEDLDQVQEIHKNGELDLPNTLKDAILWFLCSTACYRFWNSLQRVPKKPISMLIHTSQNTEHHQAIYGAIQNWLSHTTKQDLLDQCRTIWDAETATFTMTMFKEQYHDYGGLNAPESMNNYPAFEDFSNYLEELITINPSHILFDSKEKKTYHKGLHFCIDNCKNNKITDDGEYVRLAYPNKEELKELTFAPAFIVIGGATLSRGLTIEGLMSTFFLRSVGQADTLMQMGRWFGYRKGYELLPRIWLTENTRDQFKFLAALDQEMRDDILRIDTLSSIPGRTGVKIKNTPKKSFIKITAKNRMQSAIEDSWDYQGVFKETYRFPKNDQLLTENLNKTVTFLETINQSHAIEQSAENHPFIWRDVAFDEIQDFLKNFHYGKRLQPFDQIDRLCNWIKTQHEDGVFDNWNIVLAGLRTPPKEDVEKKTWKLSFGSIFKVNRSKKNRGDTDVINIGYLSATQDIAVDVPQNDGSDENENPIRANNRRILAGLGNKPQLIIYCVDKDSKYTGDDPLSRSDLESKVDLIGLCLLIPGSREPQSNYASALRIKLPEYTEDEFGNPIE